MDSSIVFREAQVVDQVVCPNDLHSCDTTYIACREVLLKFDASVRQNGAFAEVALQLFPKASVTPGYLGLAREAKGQTSTVDHKEKAGGQVDRTVHQVVFSGMGGRQFAAYFVLNLTPDYIRLDLLGDVDDIAVTSKSEMAATVS